MGLRTFSRVTTVAIMVTSFLASSWGCSITRPHTVLKNDYIPAADEKILSVDLVGGGQVEFDEEGAQYSTEERVIRGTSKAGVVEEISIDEVDAVRVDRVANGPSLAATFAGLLTLSLVVMYTLGMHAQWFSD
jgi:hypothetical protein